MTNTNLTIPEIWQGLNDLADTVWLISLEKGELEIIKDSMTPELESKKLD